MWTFWCRGSAKSCSRLGLTPCPYKGFSGANTLVLKGDRSGCRLSHVTLKDVNTLQLSQEGDKGEGLQNAPGICSPF